MIELVQLQHLVAVSEHGTISAAAEARLPNASAIISDASKSGKFPSAPLISAFIGMI